MTRAVVFLTATMLLASFGLVAQNNSPSGGQASSAQSTAPVQNGPASPAATTSAPANAPQGATQVANKGSRTSSPDNSAQGRSEDPRTASSAELPQTSTILPLLGLLGLGSLVAGLFARR